jgi:hypothetical protein
MRFSRFPILTDAFPEDNPNLSQIANVREATRKFRGAYRFRPMENPEPKPILGDVFQSPEQEEYDAFS